MTASEPPADHKRNQFNGTREPQTAPLLAAGRLLADHGVYGLAWLAEDLTVTARYGPITEALELGEPVTTSLPMLFGYEPEFAALLNDPARAFALPAVKLITSDHDGPRLNLTAFANRDGPGIIMLIGRVMAQSDAETELSRQMRARLIAEEEVARKSRELSAANAELELANRDLEDYAAVISHDLKAPLRNMRYIADDIEAAMASKAPDSLAPALDALRTQSRRMSTMLSALLDYASVGRKAEIAETVDTFELINRIKSSSPLADGFEITIQGTWPTIKTVSAPLDLVLRNLIDNAIKHHDRQTGTITVSAGEVSMQSGAFLTITVADDGPGIDEKHRDAIWLPFRTLRPSGETDSSGMGLAFVRRTLETLGGTIQIFAKPDGERGATFQINWPKILPLGTTQ